MESFYVSLVHDLLGVFVEYKADSRRAVELYLDKTYFRNGVWKLPWCGIYKERPLAPCTIVQAQCGRIYEADFEYYKVGS
jgi:hypothetical protein